MKKKIIRAGAGNSIVIQAHFDGIVGPHPLLENFPYGAETKNRVISTTAENEKMRISENE